MPVLLTEYPRNVGIGIRPALIQDLARIMEIERLAFGEQWDYYQFKASLDDIFLLAVDAASADIVGFLVACCCEVSRRGVILRLAVHPDYQGQSIATQLMHSSIGELKKKDLDEVELDVEILRRGAVSLYEKVGFKVVAVFSPSEEDDDTFCIMRKKLS
jgi:ribosomal-protein-alanine N-acetyltransferase